MFVVAMYKEKDSLADYAVGPFDTLEDVSLWINAQDLHEFWDAATIELRAPNGG